MKKELFELCEALLDGADYLDFEGFGIEATTGFRSEGFRIFLTGEGAYDIDRMKLLSGSEHYEFDPHEDTEHEALTPSELWSEIMDRLMAEARERETEDSFSL